MKPLLPTLLLVLLGAPPAQAGLLRDSPATPTTLRDEAEECKLVLVGRLENARETPEGGTTDFVITRVVRADPKTKLKVGDVIRMPRYAPDPDPKKPSEFLVFGEIDKGKPDIYRGEPVTPALLDYFSGSLKIDAKDGVRLMRHAFDYLEHKDRTIREDAYRTFDKAADAKQREAGRHLDARKLRGWLQAEETAKYRLRLYAMLLADCGDKTDAALLRKLLDEWAKEESVAPVDGGLIAYTVLDPKAGLAYTRDLVKDADRVFAVRYAGLLAAKYFWTTRHGVLTRDQLLEVVALAMTHGDMADLPIKYLREWRCWVLTEEVLGLFGKKGFEAPIVRREIVKYALRCPDPRAAKFVAELRKTDPELVEKCERWLKDVEPVEDRPDILLADFEGETYAAGWKATGTAFGKGPAKGTLPNQMAVTGFLGKGLVNSFLGGDDGTGTLTSPAFKVERKYLNFLVGGGNHPGKACVNLLVGGKVVRTATGPNDKPGGSEHLDWHTWDVGEFEGKDAVIQIVDEMKGGWGHINADHFVQGDKKKQAEPVKREIAIDKQYLHLPVKTGAPVRRMKFVVGAETVREFDIELADDKPDYWAFADVSAFKGKTLAVETTLPADSKALDAIKQAADLPDAEKLYREKHRPLFHFTSRFGWLNDPNGLVYYDKEWHLFYQHNPYGANWGNMHWGHAVSADLVRWKELGIGLYPKKYGDWAFSGSAVVDKGNTSGWGTKEKPALVLAYTSTGRGECVAYSTDSGRTWKEYEKNPVVKHVGRDPKLVWYEKGKHWVMAVYTEADKKQWIAFHTSPDLKEWTFASRIEGFYECPDLFEMPVRDLTGNRTEQTKWVLYAADGKYLLGEFDGKEFKPDFKEKRQLWYGRFYAAQTFDNTPNTLKGKPVEGPGRRFQIGWAQGVTFPGMPFNQQMTAPVELNLRTYEEGDSPRLTAYPVMGFTSLREREPPFTVPESKPLVATERFTLANELDAFDIDVTFDTQKAKGFVLDLRGTKLVYDAAKGTLTCKDVTAPVHPWKGLLNLRILVDRGSVEVFAGATAMSIAAIPAEKNRKVELIPDGEVTITRGGMHRMKSAWEK